MSDTTKRDAVLAEFPHIPLARHGLRFHRLADEIVRLRERLSIVEAERENVSSQLWDCMNEREGLKHKLATVTAERDEYVKRASVTQKMVYDLHRANRILAALRAPIARKMLDRDGIDEASDEQWREAVDDADCAIRAAVAAAEQEVGA